VLLVKNYNPWTFVDVNFTKFITLCSNTNLCGTQFELVKPRSVSVRDAIFFRTELLMCGIVGYSR
jgi:hypothetical protein